MASTSQYYVTEAEVARLFAQSGLPAEFQRLFARDYVALKADAGTISDLIAALENRVDDAEGDIVGITAQLVIIDRRIDGNDTAIAAVEIDLDALSVAFLAHQSASSAHGATGDIVGNGDFATAAVGGVVTQAAAVADQAASTVSVTSSPNAAGAAYLQADPATWVTMLNELKTDINQLVTDVNALTTKFNSSLSTERTAAQRAT